MSAPKKSGGANLPLSTKVEPQVLQRIKAISALYRRSKSSIAAILVEEGLSQIDQLGGSLEKLQERQASRVGHHRSKTGAKSGA